MPNLNLSFTASAYVVVLLILLAVIVSIYFYRTTVPPVSLSKRVFLITLRAVALSLLVLFFFEPLLRLISTSTQNPVLAVLVDNSKSMGIKDNVGDRAAQLKQLLGSGKLNGSAGDLRIYTFGAKSTAVDELHSDSLKLNEDATDITAALRKIAEERERLNIGAAVLLTDGSYNLGQNPLYEAEQLGIPLYTVGIGDSTEQRDVMITKIVSNNLVYSQTEVPVDITLKSSGYKGERVEVVLSESGKELSRTQVLLESGTREYSVRLSYIPEGEGVRKYSVRISTLPGELTSANNQKAFFARILKKKLRVLILAGAPSADVTAVRFTLSEDKNLDVRSLTQRMSGGFYGGELTARQLDSADCLVLIGFPVASTADATLEMLRAALAQKSMPVLYIDGKGVSESKRVMLSSVLPFTAVNISDAEQLVFVEPLPAQKYHPVLATHTEEGAESWMRLPPVYKTLTSYKAKTEATVLALTKINNIVLSDPLIVLRNVNKQKSLAVLGYGVWRWRLMAQGTSQSEKLLSTFLVNSVRWLTTRDDNRPVKVTPAKEAFTQGEPLEFSGQVYDASANPVENAQLKLVALHQGREFETTLRSIGNGLYEGTLEGLGEGDYTFKAAASADGQILGEDKGRFTVGELALEFQDTRMNVQLLRQLAARTGGEFFTPATFDGLRNILASQSTFVSRDVQHAREFELWNWKYMLAFVVLLFAMEWFVRKRSGMV